MMKIKTNDDLIQVRPATGEHYCDYQCWDWRLDSVALIATKNDRTTILEYAGGALDYMLGEWGSDETHEWFEGLEEEGILVWSGNLVSSRDRFGDYDEELHTVSLRDPTDDEWKLLREGARLWDPAEWSNCEEHKKYLRGDFSK